MPTKLVLVVVDAMHPGVLQRCIEDGSAPTFGSLVERGTLLSECVSSFPSVTPVCSADIMMGAGPDAHGIMGMNWFHRVERRYIEYGTSFEATRVFGLFRAMYDLVYNMNLEHLSWETETIYERLGDAGVRTATTPFLIWRGRKRHELGLEGLAKRAVAAANFRHAVWAPDEFFYGDLYASRSTGCGPNFTRPGTRDEYAACVGEELIRQDAFDFFCFSLPDNDFHSHRFGADAQAESIAKADASTAQLIEAAGGLDAFLKTYSIIVTADHAQSDIEHPLALTDLLAEDWRVLQPNDEQPETAQLAVSPTSRAGAVYLLETGSTHTGTHAAVREKLGADNGVDLTVWLADADGAPVRRASVGAPGDAVEAVVEREGHAFRFRPGGVLADERGVGWTVSGDPRALDADLTRGRFETERYPDALTRLWSAVNSPHAGDVLISAADGYECVDWGGVTHVGGGSHGALAREDSLAPLIFCGCGPADAESRKWALRDLAPAICDHFGVR